MENAPIPDGRRKAHITSRSFLTPKEGIALDIIFGLFGESRFNSEFDEWGTYGKYLHIASRAPKLEAMHADVNRVLSEMKAGAEAPFEICYFKTKDHYPWYEEFPASLSLETVRNAWVKSGMRALQRESRRRQRLPRERSN